MIISLRIKWSTTIKMKRTRIFMTKKPEEREEKSQPKEQTMDHESSFLVDITLSSLLLNTMMKKNEPSLLYFYSFEHCSSHCENFYRIDSNWNMSRKEERQRKRTTVIIIKIPMKIQSCKKATKPQKKFMLNHLNERERSG